MWFDTIRYARYPAVVARRCVMIASALGAVTIATPLGPARAEPPDPCYLVTNDGIEQIPCDFRAAATDALRYASIDSPEARQRAERRRQQALHAPPPSPGPLRSRFRHGSRPSE
jgi:hypothetical protein